MKNINIVEGRDILDYIKKIEEEYPRTTCKLIAPGHVFDDEQSVRWNREERERQNAAIIEEHRQRDEARKEANRLLEEAIIEYVMNYPLGFKFCRKAAERIIQEAREQRDGCWYEWLDDFIDFAADVYQSQNFNEKISGESK